MVERQGKNTDTKWQDLEFYNRWISRRVFDYALLIDEFDDIKSALTDPTSSAIQGALMAANRRKDRVIVEAFGATAYTGENADIAVPVPVGEHPRRSARLRLHQGEPAAEPRQAQGTRRAHG